MPRSPGMTESVRGGAALAGDDRKCARAMTAQDQKQGMLVLLPLGFSY
jgi:hypothetical protein